MHWLTRGRLALVTGALLLGLVGYLGAQGAYNDRTDIYVFQNGFKIGAERLSGMSRSSATAVGIGGSDVATMALTASTGVLNLSAAGSRLTMPATQVIASGGTIAADACGGVKYLSSASAVTTDTTNTLAAPTAALAGCVMILVNTNASNAITLDSNALTLLVSGANVALAANSSLLVGCDGTVWRQLSAQLTAT